MSKQVKLVLNGKQLINFETEIGSVIVPRHQIERYGNNSLNIFCDDEPIMSRVLDLQDEIGDIQIIAPNFAEFNSEIPFQFVVGFGTFFDVEIWFGDEENTTLFFSRSAEKYPIVVDHTFVYTYTNLGVRTISMVVSNKISRDVTQTRISIERPIREVEVLTENVTLVETPVQFILVVDQDVQPLMPFTVIIIISKRIKRICIFPIAMNFLSIFF